MLENESTSSFPVQISTFDELCAFIDASPVHGSIVHEMSFRLDEILEFVCDTFSEDLSFSPYSTSSEPRTPVNPPVKTRPRSKSSQNIVSTAEHNDLEIAFDPNEWLVTDSSTQKRRAPLLHEFLRLLLNNSRYQPYISWVNRGGGVFKMNQPIQVANLWKLVKRRRSQKSMDYNTLARGIRSYYDSGLMVPTRTKYTFRFAEETLESSCD